MKIITEMHRSGTSLMARMRFGSIKLTDKIWLIVGIGMAFHILMATYSFYAGRIKVWEYNELAINIASGKGFVIQHLSTNYYAFCMPLYSFLCSLVYKLFGVTEYGVLIFQILLSGIHSIIIFLIGEKIFNKRVALLSASMFFFIPGLTYYNVVNLHSLALDSLFISFICYLSIRIRENFTVNNCLIYGFFSGLGFLSRGTVVAMVMSSFSYFLITRHIYDKQFNKMQISRRILPLIFVIMAFIVTISPWIMRNSLIFGKFVTVSLASELLWRGNNPVSIGTSYTTNGKTVISTISQNTLSKLKNSTEIEQGKIFMDLFKSYVYNYPLKFIKYLAVKVYYFWSFSPSTGISYAGGLTLLYKIYYATLFFFFLIGTAFVVQKNRLNHPIILIILQCFSISLLQSVFYVEGRHRFALEPMMMLIAINYFMSFIDKIWKNDKVGLA